MLWAEPCSADLDAESTMRLLAWREAIPRMLHPTQTATTNLHGLAVAAVDVAMIPKQVVTLEAL